MAEQNSVVTLLEELRLRATASLSLWGRDRRIWRDLPLLLALPFGNQDDEKDESETLDPKLVAE
ncbi:hypothetical protein OQA88_10552 [Cercophora sp. LCS_1]